MNVVGSWLPTPGYVRVIDDSDEDYLYPAQCFTPLELPGAVKRALLV